MEGNGLLWRFRLREGLKFHDGEPVRGRDCIASIRRWAQRDGLGQVLMARVAEMTAPDDRSFTIRLDRRFGPMLETLAKIGPSALFVMPERIAATDANTQIREVIGSGPFRFRADERVVGARVVYERNPDYIPREGRPSWAAGPKRVHFDRVEWTVMPDARCRHRRRRAAQRRGGLVGEPAERPGAGAPPLPRHHSQSLYANKPFVASEL